MNAQGNIRKLKTELSNPVSYYLPIGSNEILMNKYIGQRLTFSFTGKIHCIKCGRETRKSFSQGFCYPCFTSAPETEECVLRPELCRAHEGIARDMVYARKHCLNPHYVYLANTSTIKVGVTRQAQVPTRWIDQGASFAIKFAKTPNRYLAGQIEVALKNHVADKTNWRNMLKNKIGDIDLVDIKNNLANKLTNDLNQYICNNNSITAINYPVERYPEKVKTINFDKTPGFSEILLGIKGQYLIFDNDYVLNIRKFGGYFLNISN